ncbi:Nitrogenase FeMo-cofactor synthesis FeS core scaffold and assembly protein NifB [Desulfovibrio sp. DV]|uniref:radical SAM protein n=1 Tax=Desulfovibrio sp. DV TaxID=1844708 RepID=UPI00094BA97E|nr:radical SAM protein [Desulfovibrio sp. DV]OLN25905.1 Nitrogenase FeMo-cofactor synthesis FeS core scaffold and assembly protein NifB [Desulfovibrio sp. DV]
MTTTKDLSKHPCFNRESAGSCGRVHLPVAPKCNIMCNFCNRKYDCVSESRPGVTSAILSPEQALLYMDKVLEKEPRITVCGIAGPGDPLANPETMEAIRLLHAKYPHLLFCLSTNGLALPTYAAALAELGVTHVTVTVNAVDPKIGARIYSWARDGKVIHRGEAAASLLLSRQIEGIKILKEHDLIVKSNTIVIPGVNDHHVVEVSKMLSSLGVDIQNIMPIFPVADTPFADVPAPTHELIHGLREQAKDLVPQMTHCKRCRADAVGLLGKDLSGELAGILGDCSRSLPGVDLSKRPYVAVATREGMLVNMHLGEAHKFQIWKQDGDAFALVEERYAPEPGTGTKRWIDMAKLLFDCRAVLIAACGETPRKVLADAGVVAYECSGLVETLLAEVYGTGDLTVLKSRRKSLGKACCGGGGEGC